MSLAEESRPTSGSELIAQFLGVSPFVRHLGLRLERLEPDRALLVADARVVRRGRSLCYCDVGVTDSDGQLVAKGLVTYKLG